MFTEVGTGETLHNTEPSQKLSNHKPSHFSWVMTLTNFKAEYKYTNGRNIAADRADGGLMWRLTGSCVCIWWFNVTV